MLQSDIRPLSPRQKLSAIDPALLAVAGAALGIGINAAGGFISQWAWRRYQVAKKKSKDKELKRRCEGSVIVFDVETVEERIVRTRKQVRVSLKRRGF
jgi:hypothetical protein